MPGTSCQVFSIGTVTAYSTKYSALVEYKTVPLLSSLKDRTCWGPSLQGSVYSEQICIFTEMLSFQTALVLNRQPLMTQIKQQLLHYHTIFGHSLSNIQFNQPDFRNE